MIKFIAIGDQILEKHKQFAFYDTVRDEFVTIGYNCVWDDFEHFKNELEVFDAHPNSIARFVSLIPEEYKPNAN